MVLIEEAATLLYLGSTSTTCLGDGLAVSRLFMDHLPSPICLPKTITQKQSLPHRSLSVRLYLSALFISPLKNGFLSVRVASSATAGESKEGISFPPVDSFQNVFIMILTFRYIIQKCTSTEEKEGGKQREGKIEPNPTISSRVARF